MRLCCAALLGNRSRLWPMCRLRRKLQSLWNDTSLTLQVSRRKCLILDNGVFWIEYFLHGYNAAIISVKQWALIVDRQGFRISLWNFCSMACQLLLSPWSQSCKSSDRHNRSFCYSRLSHLMDRCTGYKNGLKVWLKNSTDHQVARWFMGRPYITYADPPSVAPIHFSEPSPMRTYK